MSDMTVSSRGSLTARPPGCRLQTTTNWQPMTVGQTSPGLCPLARRHDVRQPAGIRDGVSLAAGVARGSRRRAVTEGAYEAQVPDQNMLDVPYFPRRWPGMR